MITSRTMREWSRLVEEVEALAVQIGLDPWMTGLDSVVSHARQKIAQLKEEVRAALAKVYPPGAIVPHEYDGPPCPTPPDDSELAPDPCPRCGSCNWRDIAVGHRMCLNCTFIRDNRPAALLNPEPGLCEQVTEQANQITTLKARVRELEGVLGENPTDDPAQWPSTLRNRIAVLEKKLAIWKSVADEDLKVCDERRERINVLEAQLVQVRMAAEWVLRGPPEDYDTMARALRESLKERGALAPCSTPPQEPERFGFPITNGGPVLKKGAVMERRARDMSDGAIAAELDNLAAKWRGFRDSLDEGWGGSPGEWMVERMGELQHEQELRRPSTMECRCPTDPENGCGPGGWREP